MASGILAADLLISRVTGWMPQDRDLPAPVVQRNLPVLPSRELCPTTPPVPLAPIGPVFARQP